MGQMVEDNLKDIVDRIVMDTGAETRILAYVDHKVDIRKKCIRRRLIAVSMVAAMLVLTISIGLYRNGEMAGVVVYAAEKDGERQVALRTGQQIEIKPEKMGDGLFGCTFRLELPENYRYEQEGTDIGGDYASTKGDTIYWIFDEPGEDEESDEASSTLRIRILDDTGNRKKLLLLKFTKENGQYFAEMKYN